MDNKTKNINMVVPYSKGLSESFKSICNIAVVQVYLKGDNTIKDQLVAPKDKDNTANKGRSYTGISVTIQGALWSTLVRQVGPFGTETRNI